MSEFAPICLEEFHLVVELQLNDDGSLDDYRVWLPVPDDQALAWKAQASLRHLREVEGQLHQEIPLELTDDQLRDAIQASEEEQAAARGEERLTCAQEVALEERAGDLSPQDEWRRRQRDA